VNSEKNYPHNTLKEHNSLASKKIRNVSCYCPCPDKVSEGKRILSKECPQAGVSLRRWEEGKVEKELLRGVRRSSSSPGKRKRCEKKKMWGQEA